MLSRCIAVIVVVVSVGRAHAVDERPQDPRAIIQRAEAALAEKRYREAAEGMEQVYALDPKPLWLANAGFAWMMAGDIERAVTQLDKALADKRLTGQARQRAEQRLEKARAVKADLDQAKDDAARSDFASAARRYEDAHDATGNGAYLVSAGDMWLLGGDLDRADERFAQVAALADVTPEARRDAEAGKKRVSEARVASAKKHEPPPPAKPDKPPEPADSPSAPILGWSLVGGGAAAIGLGVAGFVISSGERSDGVAKAATLTQDEADTINGRAETWWNVGLVASIVGAAAVATGVVLVVTHDGGRETAGSVQVGAFPSLDGGLVTATARF